MIQLDVKGIDIFKKLPEVNVRALEMAIDSVAFSSCKPAVYDEMVRVFDNPTRYTMNSLQVTKTRRHNQIAYIWFKDPDRMIDHYLLPQVEGGARKLKGFERALDGKMFIPGVGIRKNKHGNVSVGQIRQILSVLGKAERVSGSMQNITDRSSKRNKAVRDYVYIKNRRGKLFPGIYRRKAKGARGAKTGSHTAGQRGRRRNSVVRARGLVPVLLVGKQGSSYRKRLDFYRIVNDSFNKSIGKKYIEMIKRLS